MSGTYRALQLQSFAPTLREAAKVVDLPIVAPGPGEISVVNRWCGINGLFDVQIARNAVAYVKLTPPLLMGVEASGVIDAVGPGVESLKVGDAVASTRFGGGYRERNVGPAEAFVRLPNASAEMLTLASTGVSAHVAMHVIGQIQPGEQVAISAAAGGLGHILVQLAKIRGCKVIAICGGARKAAFVKELGADVVIDYRSESIAEILKRDYPDALNLAIDTVGGDVFDAFAENLAPHGRLVVAGVAQDLDAGPELVLAPRIGHKLYYKSASIRGFMNGRLTEHWPAARADLLALYDAGKLVVRTDETLFDGVDRIYDAVDWLTSGKSMGKVVARLSQD